MHIVITYPFTLGIPGGSPFDCVSTALHLRSAGAEVTVVPASTLTLSRFPRPPVPQSQLGTHREDELRKHGIEVMRVASNPLHWWLDGIAVHKAISAVMAQKRVDAVLSWYHEAAFLPALLRSKKVVFGMIAAASYAAGRIPAFGQLMSSSNGSSANEFLATDFLGWTRRKLAQAVTENLVTARSLRNADVVFARSSFTSREIVKLFGVDPQRVTISYCGVSGSFAQVKRAFDGSIRNFIYYGSFVPPKGVFDLLDALGHVAARGHRDWTLRMAGWGAEDQVRQAAHKCGISDRIELLGRLDHLSLSSQLEWADLAIMPSHAESFGLAVAEAQAAGLPVIACDVGGVPEVVENGITAWLVPPRRGDLLADAIVEAMRHPKRTFEMGLAGRERVTRLFSWKTTASTMLDGIAGMIADKE